MTQFNKKHLLEQTERQKPSPPAKGQKEWRSALIEQEARWIVEKVLEQSENINVILNDLSSTFDFDHLLLAKDVVYCCLAMTGSHPLFSNPDCQACFKELKRSICSFLFESIYKSDPSGSQFELFACVFEKEYTQLRDEVADIIRPGVEKESKEPTFLLSQNIVESLIEPAEMDDDTKDLVLERLDGLVRLISLKISKTLLS